MLAFVTQPGFEWLDLAAAFGVPAALAAVIVVVGLIFPGFFFGPFLWVVARLFLRPRVLGRENVPKTGPALLVSNHVTMIDWVLLRDACPRKFRFLIWSNWQRHWLFGRFVRHIRCVPIDGKAGPRAIRAAMQAAEEMLKAGEVVCIFAEGGLSRNGNLLPFQRGFEQLAKRAGAPVVPVRLDGLWGSMFSHRGGMPGLKWPVPNAYPVAVTFGKPLPHDATPADARQAVQELSAESARVADVPLVHRMFVRNAHRHPFRTCLIDTAGEQTRVLSYGKTLAGAMCLAAWLRRKGHVGEKMVGVWLPSSVGGALANLALALLGKTSVNLNYTAGPDALTSSVKQTGLKVVLSSKRFRSRMPLDLGPDVTIVDLEDALREITNFQRTVAFLKVLLLPSSLLEWSLGLGRHKPDDLLTVIFSSGSTGEPKGVMLTHRNIAANTGSMAAAVDMVHGDRLLGILPFFHSFGYTVTIWMPLQVGASTLYHADPRQAKEIGELCKAHKPTVFLATPTFLRFMHKRCGADDFRSLRLLICGAEKLPTSLADEFLAKFGIRPLEGYGCTELSPVVSTNLPDVEIAGVKQVANKIGTIGQPLPGVAGRIVDPETLAPKPTGEEGLLLISGGNVMAGYLGRPDLTEKAIRDGWYITGDMGRIDAEGFITLTGRLARFAKVGGEMVPLERVEDELQKLLGSTDRLCAVAAVPCERRGERLVVLYTDLHGTEPRDLCKRLSETGMPNLWHPGERDFVRVPELPVLGSGKLDLKRVKEMAVELCGG